MALLRPEHWSGAVAKVGGGPATSLSLCEASVPCEEITGHELEVGRDPTTPEGDVRIYLSDCGALGHCRSWMPRRSAHQNMADIYTWLHDHERLVCRALVPG